MKQRFPRVMISLGLCLGWPLHLFPAQNPTDEAPTPIHLDELREFVDHWMSDAMEEAEIPGVAFSLVQGGAILYQKGYGWADVAGQIPVDPETSVFRVGSVSKPVATTVVLAALEKSGLTPENEVGDWLGDLDLRAPYAAPLTFRHLLTHTAGFNEQLFGQHVPDAALMRSLETTLRRMLPPRFIEPGRVIAYVDFHTCLAALAAARARGSRFEDLAESTLFPTVGMQRSTFRQVDLPVPMRSGLAKSYRTSRGAPDAYPRDYILTTPAAGLFSTAHDMGLYLLALAGNERSAHVMSLESWELQKRLQFSHHPKQDGRSFGFVHSRRNGHRVLSKDGQASGFSARLVLLPDYGVGWFSVHNRNIVGPMGVFNRAASFHRRLAEALMERFFPRRQPLEPVAPEVPEDFAERLSIYLGTYRDVVASRHTWEKILSLQNEVQVTAHESGRLRLAGGLYTEISPGLLQWSQGHPFYVSFALGDDGRATHLFYGTGAFERIPWYATSRWTQRLLGFSSLVLLLGGTLSLWRLRCTTSSVMRRCHMALVGTAACDLLFVSLLFGVLYYTDTQQLFWGAPWGLIVALGSPLLGVVALVALLWGILSGWSQLKLGWRVYLTAQAAAALLFVWLLHQWNLLGWRL